MSDTADQIRARTYEHFMEDHEPKPWTPNGQCAGYKSRGSLATHLFRCEARASQGPDKLLCYHCAKKEGA